MYCLSWIRCSILLTGLSFCPIALLAGCGSGNTEKAGGTAGEAGSSTAGAGGNTTAGTGGNAGSGTGGDAGQSNTSGMDGSAPAAPDFVWYVLDETQGTVAKDSSSHHYDITNLTGVTWGQGASFDGVSGGGSVQVDPSYRSPPITISAWLTPIARADESSTNYVLTPYPPNAIGDDIPGQWGFGLGLNVWTDSGGGSSLSVEDVDTCQGSPVTPHPCTTTQNAGGPAVSFTSGQEYFVVATIGAPGDGGTSEPAHVYVNGALFDETTAGPISNTATTLWLGEHNDDTGYGTRRVFSGRIRDVRVYKRELGPDEVMQMYAAGPTTVAPL